MSGRRPRGSVRGPAPSPAGPHSAGSVSVRHSSGELRCRVVWLPFAVVRAFGVRPFVGLQGYLLAVLVCISVMTDEAEHLSVFIGPLTFPIR